MAIFTFIPSLWAAQAEFYVSPSGSDKNPGTKAKPFQTITHARDSVAKINSNMTGDIVVHLAGGAYEISESVVFDVNDSGTNGHKVIYKAIAGQTPMVVVKPSKTGRYMTRRRTSTRLPLEASNFARFTSTVSGGFALGIRTEPTR